MTFLYTVSKITTLRSLYFNHFYVDTTAYVKIKISLYISMNIPNYVSVKTIYITNNVSVKIMDISKLTGSKPLRPVSS